MGLLRLIGNVLWFIGGGLISFLTWLLLGVGLCITIIGIPFGIQCLKVATLVLAPFGKEVVYGGKTGSFLMNILWLPLGLVLCLEQVALGLIYCITIIGFPAGLQAFKMAKLALMPFGAEVRKIGSKKKTTAKPTKTTKTAEPASAPTSSTKSAPAATPTQASTPASTPQSVPSTTQSVPSTTTAAAPVAAQPTIATPATEVAPAQLAAPAQPTPETTSESSPEEEIEEKPALSPVGIVAIVVGILAVICFAAFVVLNSFILGTTIEPMPREIESVQKSEPVSFAPTIEDIKLACINEYDGEFTALGVSYINDYEVEIDSYFCKTGTEPNVGFLVYESSEDYQTLMEVEAEESGVIIDPAEYANLTSDYVNRLLSSGILYSVETPVSPEASTIFSVVRENIILKPSGLGSDDVDSLTKLIYPQS